MANYIGKIAAVVTVNNQQLARGLNASARDVDRFARGVRSTITSATGSAGRSFDQIFTSVQRLERAIQQARIGNLNIGVSERDADRIRALVGAANDLSRPLQQSVRGFENLSSAVQNEFIGSLVRAQNAAQLTQNAIERGQIRNAQGYENLKRVIDQVTESQRRLSEADTTVRGLATGRELRFQQSDFAAELQRAAATQASASALPADARRNGAVAQLVELQRREAEEATRLLAVLENIRNTRRGDAAAAQAALDNQVQRLNQVTSQLDRQVRLSNELRAITSSGPRGNELAFTNPGLQRELQASAAARQAAADSSDPARFAGLVQQLTQVESLIVGIQEDISAKVTANVDTTDAQRRLEQARETARRYRDEIESGILALASQEREQELIANTGARTPLRSDTDPTGRTIQQRSADIAALRDREAVAARQRSAEEFLGLNIPETQRGLASLGASVNSVRDQIGQLPDSVRGQFIPALRDAQQEYVRLVTSGTATADQIQEAATRARALSAEVTRADRAAQAFGGTFRDFADAGDFRAAEAGLNLLRGAITGAAADTTLAESAVDRYARALLEASTTPGGFRERAAELEALQREAIESIAALEGVGLTAAQIRSRLGRLGDVARGSFGVAQLAIQQAAFAVDDFFSVTGDLSQRIRAAGNNISQLGFILGSTEGLVAGVAVSIGAQLVSAILRWVQAGRTAEIQTKALNDALAQQKSLVDELARAFQTLGNSFARSAFSSAAASAREFRKELEEIEKRQRQLREERLFSLDERVLTARADVAVAENRLREATTREDAVAAQQELRASRSRLSAEQRRVREAPPISSEEIADIGARALRAAALRNFFATLQTADPTDPVDRKRVRQAAEASLQQELNNIREERAFLANASPEEQLNTLRLLQSTSRNQERFPAGDKRLAAELEELIVRLQDPLIRAADARSVIITRSAAEAAAEISDAQERVARAVREGVPAAFEVQAALDRFATLVDTAQQNIADAQQEFAEGPQGDADRRRRDERIQAADNRLRLAAEGRRDATNAARILEQRLAAERRFLPESRLNRIRQNLDNARAQDGGLAQAAARLETIRDQVISDLSSVQSPEARQQSLNALQQVNKQIFSLEAASNALLAFTETINRAEGGVRARFLDAQDSLDAALERDVRFSTPATRQELARAQEDLERQRRSSSRVQAAIDEARRAVESELGDNQFRDLREERQRIVEELSQGNLDQDGVDTRRRRVAQIDEIFREVEAEVAELAQAQIRADIFEQQRRQLERRGFELLASPGERAGRELAEDLEAIRLAAGRRAEETTGLVDQAGLQEAQQRRFREAAQQVSPLLVGFADEVQNSILQGPSRAALQASDASTLEGQRELNRLLRGEDPARDVNLAELQRQTQALDELVKIAREGPQVAE